MKSVGIDIGTTTISIVVVEQTEGKVIEAKTLQNGSFVYSQNEWERIQDVSMIIQKVMDALEEIRKHHCDIRFIGLTGQMHGILYLDKKGQCVSPLYTWQDGRGNLIMKETGKTLVDWIYDICGVKGATGYGLITHIYNSRYKLVPEEAVSFCTIADYLGMLLVGRKIPLLHVSNAASLGFFDVSRKCFREEELRKIGINEEFLPQITENIEILGEYHNIPVGVAIGDNQASFLGTVGTQDGGILLNMGTGGQISVLSKAYFEEQGIEARPFLNGTYLLVGASLCGGRAYAVLEHFLRSYAVAAGAEDRSQYEFMEQLVAEVNGENDIMEINTVFSGTRTNPKERGCITNISEDNFTPGNMIYGFLKGMVKELYDMYVKIEIGTGIQVKRLIASGNGFRKNKTLQKISSEMFQARLELVTYEEEAAVGAALSVREYIR